MLITLTTERDEIISLEVSHDLTLGDLKALVEIETAGSTNPETMLLIHNMAPMTDLNKTLGDYNIQEGDIVMIVEHDGDVNVSNPTPNPPIAQSQPQGQSFPVIDWGSVPLPGSGGSSSNTRAPEPQRPDPDNPDNIRQHYLSNPHELSTLRQQNPRLAEALLNEDPQVFREALQQHTRMVREMERQRIQMINADPFDPETQSRIAQTIDQRNIEENMSAAIEYTPESFSRVVMLYVNIKVNGVHVKALVDSGARATIMSERCAERCNIMRLVDRRFAGIAFGVGRQTIIGKVHLGQIQLGNDFLTSSFQVLKDQSEDMLLGLDMLRRHQCCIDLKDDVLRVGTTGNSVPFLKESELKEKEEMEKQQALASMEDEDAEMAKAVAQSEQQGSSVSSSQLPGPSQTNTQSTSFPEESIQQIISAGFTREAAIQELTQCNGNARLALASLLAKSLQF